MTSPGGGKGPGRLRIGERLGLVKKAGEHGYGFGYYLKILTLFALIVLVILYV